MQHRTKTRQGKTTQHNMYRHKDVWCESSESSTFWSFVDLFRLSWVTVINKKSSTAVMKILVWSGLVSSCPACLVLPCFPCRVASCLLCDALSSLVLLCHALPCLVLSCLVSFCFILSCLVLSGVALCCLIVPCFILSRLRRVVRLEVFYHETCLYLYRGVPTRSLRKYLPFNDSMPGCSAQ